jgi:hypothetical protein
LLASRPALNPTPDPLPQPEPVACTFAFERPSVEVSADKAGGTEKVSCLCDPPVEIPPAAADVDWIKAGPDHKAPDDRSLVHWHVSANDLPEPRVGRIRVGDATFTITQASRPPAPSAPTPAEPQPAPEECRYTIFPAIVDVPAEGGSGTAIVYCSCPTNRGDSSEPVAFPAPVVSADWIEAGDPHEPVEGLSAHQKVIHWHCAANEGVDPRVGTITIGDEAR